MIQHHAKKARFVHDPYGRTSNSEWEIWKRVRSIIVEYDRVGLRRGDGQTFIIKIGKDRREGGVKEMKSWIQIIMSAKDHNIVRILKDFYRVAQMISNVPEINIEERGT